MSHPYFFVSPKDVLKDSIYINGDDLNHLKNVLRSKDGDYIEISDNLKYKYTTKISQIRKNRVELSIVSKKEINKKTPETVLFQCILKKNAMEYAIEKATEIGVSKIYPVLSKRVVVEAKKTINKIKRWQKIANEASKQSKRDFLCSVEPVINLMDIRAQDYDFLFLPYEQEKRLANLEDIYKKWSNKPSQISVLIGPEGGFEQTEIDYFNSSNTMILSLGSNILKSQTATVYFLSVLDYFLKTKYPN
jgi:16S rRNA (uracil1498-N3)-methyltransferase